MTYHEEQEENQKWFDSLPKKEQDKFFESEANYYGLLNEFLAKEKKEAQDGE